MNRNLLGACAAFLLITNPTMAQDISETRISAFSDLIASMGCKMTEDVAKTTLPENGFAEMSEVQEIVRILIERNDAVVDSGLLVLAAESCNNNAPGTPKTRFIEVLVKNGCTMSEGEAERLLPAIGLSKSETREIVGEMRTSGELSVSGNVIVFHGGECQSSDSALPGQNNLETFLSVLRANDCQINKQQAASLMPPAGLSREDVDTIVETLVATQQATIESIDDRSTVVLSEETCQG